MVGRILMSMWFFGALIKAPEEDPPERGPVRKTPSGISEL